jgi:hypothetical protein
MSRSAMRLAVLRVLGVPRTRPRQWAYLHNTQVNPATTWTPTAALTPGQNYTLYAGAVSNSGTVFWSAGQAFSNPALDPPTLSAQPSGTIAAAAGYDSPTFIAGACSYDFYHHDNSSKQVPDHFDVGSATS